MIKLMLTLMKVSLIGLGGGYGMLPIMKEEIVERKGLMKDSDFLTVIAKAQSIPGPIALNTAILLGKMEKGILGSILCAISVALPPFFTMLAVAVIFERFRNVRIIESFMKGARVGITIIILNFALDLIKKLVNHRSVIFLIILLIAGSLFIVIFKIPSIVVFLIVSSFIFQILKHEEDGKDG